MNRILACSGLIFLSSICYANDDYNDVLTIDRSVINSSQLQFPNDKKIYPNRSDFEVINYVLMSSPIGERWATVTLRNNADGKREFNNRMVMALFANGKRKKPQFHKYSFDGNEILTVSLNFGVSKFPLLEVYTRHD